MATPLALATATQPASGWRHQGPAPHVHVPDVAPAGTSQIPEQHAAPTVQGPPVQTQGAWQVPLVPPAGTSQAPEQQSPLTVQLPPLPMQDGSQAPLVMPAGMMQAWPAQHSASARQAAPETAHARNAHSPLGSQCPEQHSALAVQLPPFPRHSGSKHNPLMQIPVQQSLFCVHCMPSIEHQTASASAVAHAYPTSGSCMQLVPAQQVASSGPAHGAPCALQARHRRMPASSGTQGTPWQHCSLNSHCSPGARHVGPTGSERGSQRRRVHTPEQHSSPIEHLSPSSAQLGRVQRPGLPAAKEQ